MEFTKEQYAALEEVANAFGVCVEKLIRSIEELAIRFQICKVETELLEMAIENIKQQEYEYYERLQQRRGPLPPYRPKTKPVKVYKRKIYWKRIRSNPKQR